MSPARLARCLLAIGLFLPLVALPVLGQSAGKKYALLVGINEYDHTNLSILRYAENDVTALSSLLQKQGFEVVLLTTSGGRQGASRAPTLANIQQQLESLRRRCKRHDIFLVALAGHGLHFNESYFCPQDANPSEKETATLLPLKRVYDELGSCGAGAKLLLVDACRNNPRLNRGRSFDASTLTPPTGVAALFSCRKGEVAFEHESYRHGIFFQHVLTGLGGKAANPDREVTWDSLVEYVKRLVPRAVRDRIDPEARQTPTQSAVEFEGVVLARTGAGEPNTIVEANKGLTVDLGNNIKLELVYIPEGEFLMGSPKNEPEREPLTRETETQHKVKLTQPFWMGKYEVTQEQYQQIMKNNPSWWSPTGDGKALVQGQDTRRCPVERVTWAEAMEFCKKVTQLPQLKEPGLLCSLPTEAQWEYACRGGPVSSTAPFHFKSPTNSLSAGDARFFATKPYNGGTPGKRQDGTCAVGSYQPNRLGLYDLHGNVSEWCADWYDGNAYNQGPRTDPTGPATALTASPFRVVRGGSHAHSGDICRAASRWNSDPDERNFGYGIGFRVVVRKTR